MVGLLAYEDRRKCQSSRQVAWARLPHVPSYVSAHIQSWMWLCNERLFTALQPHHVGHYIFKAVIWPSTVWIYVHLGFTIMHLYISCSTTSLFDPALAVHFTEFPWVSNELLAFFSMTYYWVDFIAIFRTLVFALSKRITWQPSSMVECALLWWYK